MLGVILVRWKSRQLAGRRPDPRPSINWRGFGRKGKNRGKQRGSRRGRKERGRARKPSPQVGRELGAGMKDELTLPSDLN